MIRLQQIFRARGVLATQARLGTAECDRDGESAKPRNSGIRVKIARLHAECKE